MTTPHSVQVGQDFHPKSQQLDVWSPAFHDRAMTAAAYQVEAGHWWTTVASLRVHKQILLSATLPPIISLWFLNSIPSYEIIKCHIIYLLILLISYSIVCLPPLKWKLQQGRDLSELPLYLQYPVLSGLYQALNNYLKNGTQINIIW